MVIMMRNHFKRLGKPFPGEQAVLESFTSERLIAIIESNPPILELLLKNPEEFKQFIPKHPQLSVMFKGKDISAIIDVIVKKHDRKEETKKEPKQEDKKEKEREEESSSEITYHEPQKNEKQDEHKEKQEGTTEKSSEPSIDDIAKLFTGK